MGGRFHFGIFVAFILGASTVTALDFHLTTNLLYAKPGSWTRRYAPNNHTYTEFVHSADRAGVVIYRLRHHDGHIVSKHRARFTAEEIRAAGASPDDPTATAGTIEHDGETYTVRIVNVMLDESPGRYYISDQIPANGILRIDILHDLDDDDPYIHWTDAYGEEPDELILEALQDEELPFIPIAS